ncbi:2-amino-4-hydroxy-6-hydroxymethyldihydropteridine diphosphokinase [Pseudomonadota bacterium]
MASTLVTAYVGLGSNLDHPQQQINRAIHELAALPSTESVVASSLYRSAPLGPQDQPDFVNAVAEVKTSLDAHELLHQLQSLEQLHQRVRERHWGPRTLDLDLLLYGATIIQTDDLIVPHPGLVERNFVLIPLYEIAPGLTLPDNRSLVDLLQGCPSDGLQRICDAGDIGSGKISATNLSGEQ